MKKAQRLALAALLALAVAGGTATATGWVTGATPTAYAEDTGPGGPGDNTGKK